MATTISGSSNSSFGGTIDSTGIDDNATSTAVTLASSGNVGIGDSSPSQKLHVAGNMYTTGYLNTAGSGTAGGVQFADGNLYMYRDTNDLAIKLQGAEKVRIQSGGGISFNGDTAAANALDDYEEGTFTVTSSDSGGIFYQSAHYVKVGRIVHVRAYFGDIGGGTTFAGLPFATEASTSLSIHQMYQVNWPASAKQLACYASGSNILFRWQTDTGVGAALSSTDTAHSSCTFGIAGTYKTTA